MWASIWKAKIHRPSGVGCGEKLGHHNNINYEHPIPELGSVGGRCAVLRKPSWQPCSRTWGSATANADVGVSVHYGVLFRKENDQLRFITRAIALARTVQVPIRSLSASPEPMEARHATCAHFDATTSGATVIQVSLATAVPGGWAGGVGGVRSLAGWSCSLRAARWKPHPASDSKAPSLPDRPASAYKST